MNYGIGDVLTFANGLIGCVTQHYQLALIDKSGLTTRPHTMPLLINYLKTNRVVSVVRYRPGMILDMAA